MTRIVILGNGNVAIQLTKAFVKSKECTVIQVYSRSKPSPYSLKKNIPTTHHLEQLKDADLYIIAISDDAISDFSKKLILKNKLVVHTSGSVAMNDLQSNSNKGVFYPLQSISKSKKISFKNIPICLEAENENDYQLLQRVANSISKKVYTINSNQRKKLHVAAVFVNNFVNHLYKIGNDICADNEIDFDILKPLIKETANKITTLSPTEAQTGPAKRNDKKTIEKQLQLLNNEQQTIYKILTESILKN